MDKSEWLAKLAGLREVVTNGERRPVSCSMMYSFPEVVFEPKPDEQLHGKEHTVTAELKGVFRAQKLVLVAT